MKHQLLAIFFLFVPSFLFSQTNFEVKGEIQGMTENSKLFLVYTLNKEEKVDSTIVKKGKFSFSGKIDRPEFSYIFNGFYPRSSHKPTSDYKRIYLEGGTVLLLGEVGLKYSIVSGTESNAELQVFAEMMTPIEKEKGSLQNQFYKDTEGKNKQEKEQITRVYNQNTRKVGSKEGPIKLEFVKRFPNSPLSQYMLPEMLGRSEDLPFFDSLYVVMSDKVKASSFGKDFYQSLLLKHKTALGQSIMDFTQNDVNGNPVNFNEFRKGKYILIDFWASWCGPCRAENPNVVKAYHAYKNYNFDIIGIALENGDKAKEAWLKAIKDDKLPWTQVTDFKFWNNEVALLYNVQSVPTNYLIDPDGKIIAKNLRGVALEKELSKVIK